MKTRNRFISIDEKRINLDFIKYYNPYTTYNSTKIMITVVYKDQTTVEYVFKSEKERDEKLKQMDSILFPKEEINKLDLITE